MSLLTALYDPFTPKLTEARTLHSYHASYAFSRIKVNAYTVDRRFRAAKWFLGNSEYTSVKYGSLSMTTDSSALASCRERRDGVDML
jgi:hypothetical protein